MEMTHVIYTAMVCGAAVNIIVFVHTLAARPIIDFNKHLLVLNLINYMPNWGWYNKSDEGVVLRARTFS